MTVTGCSGPGPGFKLFKLKTNFKLLQCSDRDGGNFGRPGPPGPLAGGSRSDTVTAVAPGPAVGGHWHCQWSGRPASQVLLRRVTGKLVTRLGWMLSFKLAAGCQPGWPRVELRKARLVEVTVFDVSESPRRGIS